MTVLVEDVKTIKEGYSGDLHPIYINRRRNHYHRD